MLATWWGIPRYFRPDLPHLVPAYLVVGALLAALLAVLPWSARRLQVWSEQLDALNASMRARAAMLVGVISSVFLALWTAVLDRPMQLLWHDEFQFHLQSQMLARFRLWMPAHPLSDFFDTFYVLMSPHYAAQSFPGAAMLFVPGVWLHLPTWVLPVMIAGSACGLLWWVLCELTDGTCALAAVAMLLCNWGFLRVSTMELSQIPVLMLGLVAFAAMLQWRQSGSWRTAAVIGVALGWAAITRPLDALCFGVVVLAGMATAMHRHFPLRDVRRLAQTSLVVITGASPFLVLQGVLNVGITGSIVKTPFALYNERDQPALAFAGVADTSKRPQSVVPQKQAFYAFATMGFVTLYGDPRMRSSILWRIRLNETQDFLAPAMILLPFAALGLAGLLSRERWLLFAMAPLFVAAYQWYPIYNAHYIIFALPALALLFALSPGVVQSLALHWGAKARLMTAMILLGASAGAVIERASFAPPDEMQRDRRAVESTLTQVVAPAIVLFTAPARPEDMHTEFVYNDDTAWPDDAPVIRAHDRGEGNVALYRYYAALQPMREVWRFDRRTQQLTHLGSVKMLAAKVDSTHNTNSDR